jgi:hypothetical protein
MKKPKMVKTSIDQAIAEVAGRTSHRTLANWAADCAERVLPHFEGANLKDKRPREAIESLHIWIQTGVFKMAEVRRASLAAHAAAREVEEGDPAHSAARAAGQAIAVAHVPAHAVAAAIYAATAVRDAANPADSESAALIERSWQYQHLLEMQREKGIKCSRE